MTKNRMVWKVQLKSYGPELTCMSLYGHKIFSTFAWNIRRPLLFELLVMVGNGPGHHAKAKPGIGLKKFAYPEKFSGKNCTLVEFF